ncbi:MAG: IS630 family transposase [Myxococcales bacterium]|nr:IS630 family transposase [Myxococcales bacterium]
MKFCPLSEKKKQELELLHRYEGDRRVCDRIKAVLLKSEGWTNRTIAQALRIHDETVRQHLTDWITDEKLKPENGGSSSKLTDIQSRDLDVHLAETTYTKVIDICAYVEVTFGVRYTISGMTKCLKQHDFSYKHPKSVPAKADLAKQEEFIEKYLNLVADTPANEPILFIDAAHPTMATKVVCGWIKKGVDKPIAQTASRTRVNIVGAIELATMNVISCRPDYVNAETTVAFFDQIKTAYPKAPKIHIILDQSGYHRSQLVRDAALEKHIELHYLPPYSPNLNSIERLWKVMNEEERDNVFFSSAKMFRDAINNFFDVKLPKIAQSLRGRINDNFQTIKPVPSS